MFKRILASLLVAVMLVNESSVLVAAETNDTSGKNVEVVWSEPTLITEEEEQVIATESLEAEAVVEETVEATQTETIEVIETEITEVVETLVTDVVEEVKYNDVSSPEDFVITNNVVEDYTGTATEVVIPDGVTQIAARAFESMDFITSVTIPESVAIIGQSAFSGCTGLTSVQLPSGLRELAPYVFYNCTGLTTVQFPEGLTMIDMAAFSGCTQLTGVTLPATLKTIEANAFRGCTSLTSIVLPDSVTGVSASTFLECTNLVEIEFPSDWNVIRYAMTDADYVKKVVIREGADSVPPSAFENNTTIEEVVLPNSITTLEIKAFSGCTSLKKLTVPDNLAVVGQGAFSGCTRFNHVVVKADPALVDIIRCGSYMPINTVEFKEGTTVIPTGILANGIMSDGFYGEYEQDNPALGVYTVIMPDTVTTVESYAFSKARNLTNITWSENLKIIKDHAFDECAVKVLVLPESLEEIGDYAFYDSAITNAIMPNNIVTIGNYAFQYCDNLVELALSKSVEHIGDYAFGNTGINYIEIPASLESVGYMYGSIFANCSNLKSASLEYGAKRVLSSIFNGTPIETVSIPASVTVIESGAFSNCTNLREVIMPSSVREVGAGAFSNCTSLVNVELSKNLERMQDGAFEYCTALTSIHIPKRLCNTGYSIMNPFYGCSNLKTFTFASGVTQIPDTGLFAGTGVENIVLPETVTSIGDQSFWDCKNLTSVTIPDTVTTIGRSAFAGCSALKSIDLPSALTALGERAFFETGLESIVIPEGIQMLNPEMFDGCKQLASVTLPESLESIGTEAFYNCDKLTSITIPDAVEYINPYAFYECDKLADVEFGCGIKRIDSYAFSGCIALTKAYIPRETIHIGRDAFAYCVSLEEVFITQNTTSIDEYAFIASDNFTIYGVSGSYAEEYAEEWEIPFEHRTVEPESLTIVESVSYPYDSNSYYSLLGEVNVKVSPAYYTEGTLEWSNSDDSVINITNHDGDYSNAHRIIYGMGIGESDITVRLGDLSAVCHVTVGEPVYTTSITLAETEVTIEPGMNYQIPVTTAPSNATDAHKFTVTSSDEDIVSAYYDAMGNICLYSGYKSGTATVTVTVGKASATITVTVTKPAQSISLSHQRVELFVGETVTMWANVYPSDATDEIVWSTDDRIATLTDDPDPAMQGHRKVITAVGEGTVWISVSAGIQSAMCEVVVREKKPVTSVSFNQDRYEFASWQSYVTINANIQPADTTDPVTWESSNTAVVSVHGGPAYNEAELNILGIGTAEITVTVGELSATCTVEVVDPSAPKPATGISLNLSENTMYVGGSTTLYANVEPENSTDIVEWSTDSPIVSIMSTISGREATIYAYGTGTAIVTATVGGYSASCVIYVISAGGSEIPATGVSINFDSITMNPMETRTLIAHISPANTTDSITWETTNPSVVSVMQGAFPNEANVYAMGPGSAEVIVRVGEYSASCFVIVEEVAKPVTSVTMSESFISMEVNGSRGIMASIDPWDTTDPISWTSSDPSIVSVTQGPMEHEATLYAYSAGTATITVWVGTMSASCTVTVTGGNIPATGITLSHTQHTLAPMEWFTITAFVEPMGCTDMIMWASSNPSVAGVMDMGNTAQVYAYNEGVAVITATVNGRVATCIVTVTSAGGGTQVPAQGISLNTGSMNMALNTSNMLYATVMPANTTDSIMWVTSNANVVSVFQGAVPTEAVVNANGVGTAVITATVGRYTATCIVTVTENGGASTDIPVMGVIISETEHTMELYSLHTLYVDVVPEHTTDRITWTTSDPSVAVLCGDIYSNQIEINSVGVGTAVITVWVGAMSASCTITVYNPYGPGPEMSEQERQVRAFVERMYTIVLNREADPNGLADWAAGLIEQRVDGAQVVNGFVGSEEFAARGLTDLQFIETLYLAVLNREADDFGISEWMRAFAQGATRQDLIDGFVSSAEFNSLCNGYGILAIITQEQLVRNFASRMYTVALNRPADEAGLSYWVSKLISGQADGAAIADGFINSPEFIARNLTNEEYIRTLYLTFLNREADEAGLNDWLRAFSLGVTRQQMLDGFIDSAEFRALCESSGISAKLTQEDRVRNFVARMYTVALGRGYDEAGLNDWVTGLINGVIKGAEVAEGFIMSAEFDARGLSNESYVQTLYQTFFNREPSADDVTGWVNAMTVYGQSRRDVLKGFVNSAEFGALCESYGIIRGEMR